MSRHPNQQRTASQAARARRRGLIASAAVVLGLSTGAGSAMGVITRTATRNCSGGLGVSSVTVTWEISDLIVNARAVKTSWGGFFSPLIDKVVTDEAFAGVLVSGGRKIWTGPARTSGSYTYAMPWSTISNGHGRTDVNVSQSLSGITLCSVRIPVPA